MLPAPPAPRQLLDLFLAGRKPKTLAACQADLEDFRRFMETRSVSAPTAGKAVEWLLDGPKGLANAFAITTGWRCVSADCRSRRSIAASRCSVRWSSWPTRSVWYPGP